MVALLIDKRRTLVSEGFSWSSHHTHWVMIIFLAVISSNYIVFIVD